MTGDLLFLIEIGSHRDVVDAVCHLETMTNAVPGRRATVMFGGYGDDPREVWEIERCVTICKAIVDAGLLPRLTRKSAWFVYRTATGMPDRSSDEYILGFVELVCSPWVPVTKRLPPIGTVVLAWRGTRVVFGFLRDGQWIDTLFGWVIPDGPTHWMPMPSPPEETL